MDFSHNSVNWEYKSTIRDEKSTYEEYKLEMNEYWNEVVSYFQVTTNLYSDNVSGESTSCKNYESDMVVLNAYNTEMKEEIKLYGEEVEKYKSECQNLKTDQKVLSGEIKKTYEAFLMAKNMYKKGLQTYFTIESITGDTCIVYVQFFTANKRHSDEYSMRIKRDMKTEKNELIEMTPRLPTFPQLCQRLLETNDMPGFLCHVRESMKAIQKKESKKINRITIA